MLRLVSEFIYYSIIYLFIYYSLLFGQRSTVSQSMSTIFAYYLNLYLTFNCDNTHINNYNEHFMFLSYVGALLFINELLLFLLHKYVQDHVINL